ncbi:MAG: DNA-directed RNA polymerase subunit D [Candidatus Micrarchaeota archaeon]
MQIDITKNEGQRLQGTVKGTSVAMMNALRRCVISDLEAFAIDEVDFYENNSSMFNDYIAARLAMVPLTYEETHAETVGITLSLNAEGPCMVYSRDLKSTDETIKVFNDNVPIIKLGPNQKLRLEGKIGMGSMKKHAKFQSALCSYNYDILKKNPEFEFVVESYNNMTGGQQLLRALKILSSKTEELSKAKELKK